VGARLNTIVPIALRVNPDIDPKTHPYIATGLSSNKFGIEYSAVLDLCKKITKYSHIEMIGVACHIGSQLTEVSPFIEAIDRLLELIQHIQTLGISLQHIDIGGGLGVKYQNETPPSIEEYVQAILKKLSSTSLEIVLEPGRILVANAGILLAKVEYLKYSAHKNFAILDAGMNDLLRPSLYDAWHDIQPLLLRDIAKKPYEIVGPVCESADFIGKNRELAIAEGDILAIRDTGAYGFSMSSNYNSRPRASEVMVDQDKVFLIRKRESFADLYEGESVLFFPI
jgi:diaminopimelate decarboxylase